jgi:hypothetical protein
MTAIDLRGNKPEPHQMADSGGITSGPQDQTSAGSHRKLKGLNPVNRGGAKKEEGLVTQPFFGFNSN